MPCGTFGTSADDLAPLDELGFRHAVLHQVDLFEAPDDIR
jgi:hypothetical protein